MNKAILSLLALFSLILALSCVATKTDEANNSATTLIILRHAEKDTVGEDPKLSAKGLQRAARLSAVFPDIHPDKFYSTNFIRTRETLAPWAKATGKEIEMYRTDNLPAFADKLKSEKGKTIVVAGHSNTVPPLVNFILAKEKYTNLTDTEYSKIFVLTIKDARVDDRVVVF